MVERSRIGRRLKRAAILGSWIAGGGALVVAVFVFAFYTAMRVEMRSTEVVVPELYGMTIEDATATAGPLDLVLQVVDQRNDPRVPSGHVLEQMPRPGDPVRRGRKVKLVLSSGGRVLEVPDLVGQAARAVPIELRRDGFVPGDEARVPSPSVPEGRVMAQVPEAGATAVPSSRVHRLVSAGPSPPTWVMPDLTGLDRREVERWIEAHGFRRGAVRRLASARRPAGTVVAQLPLAGYPVRGRDVIELAIAE
jgi:serine/threonine-protein kinase